MSKKIILIPHGAGNLASITEVFHQLGYFPQIADSCAHVQSADMVVIPGVGASGSAMDHLNRTGFVDALTRLNESQRPIVGICLGAQLMFNRLHENNCDGLKLLQGEVVRIANEQFNNGWNDISLNKKSNDSYTSKSKPILLKNRKNTFYFNHGYHINTKINFQESASICGELKVLAYFLHNNLCGIQFHPEKSQKAGLVFLKNTMKHYGF